MGRNYVGDQCEREGKGREEVKVGPKDGRKVTDLDYIKHIEKNIYQESNHKLWLGFLLEFIKDRLRNEKGICPVGWISALADVLWEELKAWVKNVFQRKK